MFFSKGEFLDEIEWAYRRVLTSEWSHWFPNRDWNGLTLTKVHPQE
jgi:hypothetical protein